LRVRRVGFALRVVAIVVLETMIISPGWRRRHERVRSAWRGFAADP
jgi:hypothetical protein